jgi:hypothetical protein
MLSSKVAHLVLLQRVIPRVDEEGVVPGIGIAHVDAVRHVSGSQCIKSGREVKIWADLDLSR